MQKTTLFVTIALSLAATATLPAGSSQTTLLDFSLGSAHAADFENDKGGYTSPVIPPPPRPPADSTWAWGSPTSGPGVAASGSKVWGTNLAGLYKANDCGAILSPPIDLSGAASASMSFKEWRHIEMGSSFAWDAGMLFVTTDGGSTFTVLVPNGGYTSTPVGSTSRTCLDGQPTGTKGISGPTTSSTPPPPVYGTISADLGAYLNQTIQIAIAFAADSVIHRAGWYIDDFTVTTDLGSAVEDFEASDGGFTIVGTKVAPAGPKGWSWGTPTNGPGPVSAMWATNPTGNHGPNECAVLTSPAFKVGDVSSPVHKATLSWDQWFKGGSMTTGGVVRVVDVDGVKTNVKPTTGYTGSPTSSLDACLQHVSQGSGGFAGTTLNPSPVMTHYEADLTTWAGQEIQLEFVFASTSSTSTNEGWYVDNVDVEVSLFAAIADVDDLLPSGDDAFGWSRGGVGTWAYGVATTGLTNQTVYGTNLHGPYATSECGWIESPAMPAVLVSASPMLTFDHWYRIESLFSTIAWDGGFLMLSTDGGATWSHLDLPEYDRNAHTSLTSCLGSLNVPAGSKVFSGDGTAGESIAVDLTAAAAAATGDIKVRWVFGSDSSVQYEGWYVTNVVLGGVKLL